MKSLAQLAASFVLALLLAGCDSGKGSSADPPADFRVTPGDAAVIAAWTSEPGVTYWIYYGPGSSISASNWASSGGRAIANVTSPWVITGLINGNTYSFSIDARKDGGPGGPSGPTVVAVPVLAGTNWAVGTPLGTSDLRGVSGAFLANGVTLLAVGAGGSLYSSVAGAAMSPIASPAGTADLNAVWYSTVGFVAVGGGGAAIFSTDGVTWSAGVSRTTATLLGAGSTVSSTYLAVGAGGAVITSTDGLSWSPVNSTTTADLYSTTFGNGRQVVVGNQGTILTSTDSGITWAASTSGTTADLRAVAFTQIAATSTTAAINRFVAVGKGGAFLTSEDGLTWVVQPPFTSQDLLDVIYGGQFVAVGTSGTIFTSLDGLSWQARASGTTTTLNAVARTPSSYLVVGDKGTTVTSF